LPVPELLLMVLKLTRLIRSSKLALAHEAEPAVQYCARAACTPTSAAAAASPRNALRDGKSCSSTSRYVRRRAFLLCE
jgi:hypothetical protein